MCRLFALKSRVLSRPHRSLLDAENAVLAQSREHPDGWGIGWFADDDAYVVKSGLPAHACPRFRQVSSRLQSHTFLVHVRRATVGTVDSLNAHPFRHGRWLFAHNGTIFGFDVLRAWMMERIEPVLAAQIIGDTDSEVLFFYVLTVMQGLGADRSGHVGADARGVAGAVRLALGQIDAEARRLGLQRPVTNVILTDGRLLVAQRAGRALFLSTQKRHCPDRVACAVPSRVCLEMLRPPGRVNHVLVASEPVGHENHWEELADGASLVCDAEFELSIIAPAPGWTDPTA